MVLVGTSPPEAISDEFRISERFPVSDLIVGFGGGEDQLFSQGEDEEGLLVVVEVLVVELSVVERIEETVLTMLGFRNEDDEEKKSS